MNRALSTFAVILAIGIALFATIHGADMALDTLTQAFIGVG